MTEFEFDNFRTRVLAEANNICLEQGEYSVVSQGEYGRVIRFTDKANEYIEKVTSHCDRLSELLHFGDYSTEQYR